MKSPPKKGVWAIVSLERVFRILPKLVLNISGVVLSRYIGPKPRHCFWDFSWFKPPWYVETYVKRALYCCTSAALKNSSSCETAVLPSSTNERYCDVTWHTGRKNTVLAWCAQCTFSDKSAERSLLCFWLFSKNLRLFCDPFVPCSTA